MAAAALELCSASTSSATPLSLGIHRPTVEHARLNTMFRGVHHPLSTPHAEIHQFRNIRYANIPARFRRSALCTSYPSETDATKFGPVAHQVKTRNIEERLYGLPPSQVPTFARTEGLLSLKHDEFNCLNLNITRPGNVAPDARLPVMIWVHGGGNVSGSGSDWICDAGQLVLRSVQLGNPVIVVAINYRMGLLGFAASPLLREDNASAGDSGVGNYGLYDQRTAYAWVHAYIDQFGGDPQNITLFGSSWGATDIHCHLLSAANAEATACCNSPSCCANLASSSSGKEPRPLFGIRRAILQSGALSPSLVQEVHMAGAHLGRIMSALSIKSIAELRAVEPERLVALTGERVRPVDDGVFFRPDWRTLKLGGEGRAKQDIVIGDCGLESVLWEVPAALWSSEQVIRRVRAIVQSVYKADVLLRAYGIGSEDEENGDQDEVGDEGYESEEAEIGSGGSGGRWGTWSKKKTREEQVKERILEMMNDCLFAWPVECAVRGALGGDGDVDGTGILTAEDIDESQRYERWDRRGHIHRPEGVLETLQEEDESEDEELDAEQAAEHASIPGVYRYIFDQASPYTDSPHHAVDLLYLFGNIPFPKDPEFTDEENDEVNWGATRVRDVMQQKWIGFAGGEGPWTPLAFANSSASAGYPGPGTRSNSFSYSTSSPGLTYNNNSPSTTALSSPAPGTPINSPFASLTSSWASMPPQSQSLQGQDQDKVFVFGPEGETGERSTLIFAARRRVGAFEGALKPLGALVAQKVGVELGNGPPVRGWARF